MSFLHSDGLGFIVCWLARNGSIQAEAVKLKSTRFVVVSVAIIVFLWISFKLYVRISVWFFWSKFFVGSPSANLRLWKRRRALDEWRQLLNVSLASWWKVLARRTGQRTRPTKPKRRKNPKRNRRPPPPRRHFHPVRHSLFFFKTALKVQAFGKENHEIESLLF